jgi:hypothetical protein
VPFSIAVKVQHDLSATLFSPNEDWISVICTPCINVRHDNDNFNAVQIHNNLSHEDIDWDIFRALVM